MGRSGKTAVEIIACEFIGPQCIRTKKYQFSLKKLKTLPSKIGVDLFVENKLHSY